MQFSLYILGEMACVYETKFYFGHPGVGHKDGQRKPPAQRSSLCFDLCSACGLFEEDARPAGELPQVPEDSVSVFLRRVLLQFNQVWVLFC